MEVVKDLAGAEDLLLDAELPDTVTQSRGGSDYSITKVNAKTIPYTGTFGHSGVVSIKDKLDNIDTSIENLGYIVDTIEDLATYTGTGLVMVKDINRGGTFISKTAIEIDPNTNELYEANNGTVFAKLGGGFWARQIYIGAVNVKWFGAKGDGTTNDIVATQKAIYFIRKIQDSSSSWYSDKVDSRLLFPVGTYLINGTLLTIGNITFCGDGANIISDNDENTPVFETAYINTEVWTSNASLPVNTLLNDAVTNLKFENLTFSGISYIFKLRGSVWQSHISNCSFYYCGVVVTANNCFYFNYLDIRVYGTKGAQFDSVARFQLSESVNRISFDRLSIGLISSVGTDGGIGISVTGGGSNLSVTNSSLEEMNKGITFTGTFNDFKINSTYVEGVKTVLETDNAIKRGFDIDIPTGFLILNLVVGSGFRNTVIKPYQDRLATTENYRGIIKLTAGTNGNRGTIVYMDSSFDNTTIEAVKYQVTTDVELIPQDWQLYHGVNANGTYIKHPNGVLIQHISKVIAYTANTNTTVILPISFKDSKFSLSFKMTAFSGYDSDIVFGDNSGGSFVLRSKNTYATNYFDITAVGRWK